MPIRRALTRLLVPVPLLAAAAVFLFTSEPVRGVDLGPSRLVSADSFSDTMNDACTWEAATPEAAAFQQAGAGAAAPSAMGRDPRVSARQPMHTIRDPY